MSEHSAEIVVREADERDVEQISQLMLSVYGRDYPFRGFFDPTWVKRSIFVDDILMLVAEENERVVGTASVVLDVGNHTDLTGEFGRLAVHPDARGRGIAQLLMQRRIELAEDRLHLALVQNRTVHPYSQQLSARNGFTPVGFLPLKYLFNGRENVSLWIRHFDSCLDLRRNHPRIIPEAAQLAELALDNCGLPMDIIVDERAAPYPHHEDIHVDELEAQGLPTLIRIERGRVANREIFGPMQLHHGFFQAKARNATYLIAHQSGPSDRPVVAGAIGYIRDPHEKTVRIFELISRTDDVIRSLLLRLLLRCTSEWGTVYIEADVSAYAPRMQRTLLGLGFLPVAYVPAMIFHNVERLDVLKMARLFIPPEIGEVALTPAAQEIADVVTRAFTRQTVLPRVREAISRLALFDGLSEEQATRVASCCSVSTYKAGERLFSSGDAAQEVHLVISGTVEIAVSGDTEVGTVGAGDAVGELSLLTGETRSATATAREDLVVANLARETLNELTHQRTDIGMLLYRNLAIGLGRKLQSLDKEFANRDDSSLPGPD